MEICFMILSLLYLSASAICFQLSPSLSVKTPVDFELEINGNLFNNEPKISGSDKIGLVNQCFCIPSEPQSELVTNFLGPKDHKLERLVAYIYRMDGKLQVFIPNKQKQKEIPDLTLDIKDGDILKPLQLHTVAEVFENNPNTVTRQPQETQFDPNDISEELDTSAETETQPILMDTNDKINIGPEGVIIEPMIEETSDTKPIDEMIFDYFIPSHEQDKPIVDLPLPSAQDPFIMNPELGNVYPNQDIGEILSHVPKKTGISLLAQMSNPRLDILPDNNNIKFNDWLDNQLSYIVLDNPGKQSNVDELRKSIQDVLKSNGMFISNSGALYDSAGNVLQMSNIKLRTILIGDPVEYLSSDRAEYYSIAPAQISYLQVVLIISIDPPQILGIVPLGKVLLPRKINNQNLGHLKKQNDGKTHFLRLSPELGCKNCKSRDQHHTQEIENDRDEVPYFELPLRRSFDNRKSQNILLSSFYETPSDIPPQPERRTSSDNDLGGMLQNILGIFSTPNLFTDQTRRLLGGKILRKDTPGPTNYINDNLPDYRIIGGKPATSSGVPIVSKGRSGLSQLYY